MEVIRYLLVLIKRNRTSRLDILFGALRFTIDFFARYKKIFIKYSANKLSVNNTLPF